MSREKIFIGPKVRELRSKRGLTQAEMASQLGVSPSYINLIERNQRSASLRFLISLSDNLGIDWRELTESSSDLSLADLREMTQDPAFGDVTVDIEELRSAMERAPNFTRGMLAIFKTYRSYGELIASQNEALSDVQGSSAVSSEQPVHDFFREHQNYFDQVDKAAHRLRSKLSIDRDEAFSQLKAHLHNKHEIKVRPIPEDLLESSLRFFDRHKKEVYLSDGLDHINKVFQLAHLVGMLEFSEILSKTIKGSGISDETVAARCRVELANYFAAAFLMPYDEFLEAAQSYFYDIEKLAARFAVSYEQICHRLTTLQRPGNAGVPFFFLRVDKGGNVAKRFNATPIQLARFGGACPRLDVHYSLRIPGRILTQVVKMPDNSKYLTINRTVDRPSSRFSNEDKRLAVALGCPIEYAEKLIYGQQIDLGPKGPVTEIGVNCRLCPRHNCDQRAHQPFFQNLSIDEDRRGPTRFES
jgi:XRE family transcriptional regulator, fatty acid utilization regulator